MYVMRPGKTHRDRISGASARHTQNQEARRKWNQEYMVMSKAGGHKIIPYPVIGK